MPSELLKGYAKRDLLIAEKLLKVRDRRIEFATKYHRNTRGEKMNFERNPYLPQLYNSLAACLTIQGAVQSKKSEFIIIDHLAMSAEGLSIFFVVPKVEARTTYVQNRVNKRISDVPEYRKLIAGGSFDNTLMKGFGRGVIKYVGSNVMSDFKEFPADAMVVEEVDQCNFKNLKYGRDRLRGSIFQFRRYVGNPTLKGVGINSFFSKSTQNVWHVPCPKNGPTCNGMIELDWFKTVVKMKYDEDGMAIDYDLLDDKWHPGCGRDIHCFCPHCGVPLDRLGRDGVWIPKNPESEIEGYLMTMMNSWENSISEMYSGEEGWEVSWGDEGAMQHFYNSNLGLVFAAESSRLTEQMLVRCSQFENSFSFVVKTDISHIEGDSCKGPCSMGVDVGKKFDVRISEILESGVRRAVFIGKVENRSELISLGIRYNVKCMVIDSMPEYRVVTDLQDEAPFPVWACRYESEGKDRRTKRDKKNRLITGDRTILLDRSLSMLKSGRNQLPKNLKAILNGVFVEEMTDSVRQEEMDKGGNIHYAWSKGKDHQRHADVYDMLASEMCSASALSGITVG